MGRNYETPETRVVITLVPYDVYKPSNIILLHQNTTEIPSTCVTTESLRFWSINRPGQSKKLENNEIYHYQIIRFTIANSSEALRKQNPPKIFEEKETLKNNKDRFYLSKISDFRIIIGRHLYCIVDRSEYPTFRERYSISHSLRVYSSKNYMQ